MDYLLNKGFTVEDINRIIDKYDDDIIDNCKYTYSNIEDVIDYLKEFGVVDIPGLMLERIDIFFVSTNVLKRIFSHYNKSYIINSLDKEPDLFDEWE